MIYEQAGPADRQTVERLWNGTFDDTVLDGVRRLASDLGIEEQMRTALRDYRQQAIDALASLTSVRLKILLHRIAGRLLPEA